MVAGLIAAAVLVVALGAWYGISQLVVSVPPEAPFALPTLYLFLFVALTATSSLLAWLALLPRPSGGRLRTPLGYVGHAMLLSTIALFGLWLQSLRMLTLTVALLLVGLYVFLELALLFGTRGSVDAPTLPRRLARS